MATTRTPSWTRPPGAPAGFTFLELLVVMALVAVLLGLGIGFIVNVGKAAQSQQAAAIVTEAAFRCQNMSAGAKRATLTLRQETTPEGLTRWAVITGVQRPILTANFEGARRRPDGSGDPETLWVANAGGDVITARTEGNVQLDDDGMAGRAVLLGPGGLMDFGTRPAFAVTHGLDVDVAVKPTGGASRMTLLRADGDGEEIWAIGLQRGQAGGGPDSFAVEVRLRLLPEGDAAPGAGLREDVRTKEACIPSGQWSRLRVSFDGRSTAVRVNGVERAMDVPAPAKGAPEPEARRFVIPASGVARITLSQASASFLGSVDTLQVSGVFRTDEDVRYLGGGMELVGRQGPLTLHFANGRLDPAYHQWDEHLRFATPGDQETGVSWRVRVGLYGSIQPPERVINALDTVPLPGNVAPSAPGPDVPPGGKGGK